MGLGVSYGVRQFLHGQQRSRPNRSRCRRASPPSPACSSGFIRRGKRRRCIRSTRFAMS